MSHGSARTTFRGRLLIVQRFQAGWPQAHIAAAMGVSRKCVRTWLDRFAAAGEGGLADRSSRPIGCRREQGPRSSPRSWRCVTVSAGEPEWIGAELGVPTRTVSRVLARHRVPRLAMLDPMTGEVIRASKHTALRYERPRPGDLVHMDVKKLGRIPDGGGWRGQGQTTANHASRPDKAPIGYDYVHSLVDDHSRLAYSEILADEKGPSCAGFLDRALDHFAAHGIAQVRQLMTDNAMAYRYSLRESAPPEASLRSSSSRTAAGRTARCPCSVARALQHWSPSQCTRRAPARQSSATNLMAGYN